MAGSLEASGHAGQVPDSDQSDISGSDIDISALLNSSDQNSPASSPTVKKSQKITNSGQASRGPGEGGSTDSVTQNDINQIILSQLNALGERLTNMENNSQKVPKKTNDHSKIKSSRKPAKREKTAVTQIGLSEHVATTSGTSSTDLPPPNKLREEARIQLEVQNRLKQLADQARPGTEKINCKGADLSRFLSYLARIRTDYPTTSSLLFSGWLASAGPCERSQAHKIGIIC